MSDLFDDQSEIKEDDPPEAAPEGAQPFSNLAIAGSWAGMFYIAETAR